VDEDTLMLILRPSPEARHIGRMIYLLAAITIGLEGFGITLASTDAFPVQFPKGFPVAGMIDELADHLHAGAVALHNASLLEDITAEDLAKYPPDFENRLRAGLIDTAPRLRRTLGYTTYVIDVVLPLALSVMVVAMSRSAIAELFSRFSFS
jgi:hypothetical protein